ncbi:hypothetical protein [Metallibacterium scheffleri]|uniref:Type II secretion system protein GspF domain-containing protein n=1 Tax=Metallibacterium scheffleri TaxID=993689 RepID=A0A4S3KHN8_9GAMM|nr:hypothetical protein [Metallibacterium scheffleri]THD08225.1 hypothetical protein B1806_13550 [Metallibacterium scheffleri]
MDALKLDDPRDFVTRQYANLVANGLNEESARARLREVLGAAAVELLDSNGADAGATRPADAGVAHRLVDAASRLGGSAADAQAALIHSLAEARLFALDWWRPVRTFLLYILFLLGLAVVIAIIYAIFVLPAFSHLDQAMGVRGGAAGWIRAKGAFRLFAPLVVMAFAFAFLTTRWFRMRQRIARLEPLASQSRFGWLHGRSEAAFQTLRCLEFAAALKAAGVADALVLEPALQVAGWHAKETRQAAGDRLEEKLGQAERLGTFGAELEWQRRLHWSTTQAQLELSRDRLILFSRVLFYILIGIMVTVLYIPIFSVASMFGVH